MPNDRTQPGAVMQPDSAEPERSLLWFSNNDFQKKLTYLNSVAGQLGKCYLRLAIFCDQLGKLDFDDFKKEIDWLSNELEYHPLGHDVFVDLAIVNNKGLTGRASRRLSDIQVSDIYDEIMKSSARVQVDRIEDSDLFHVHALSSRPFCECLSPVCEHGWNARMSMVVLSMQARRVGASGFNMDDFMDAMNGATDDNFEESFSQVTPTPESMDKSSRRVQGWKDVPEGLNIDKQKHNHEKRSTPIYTVDNTEQMAAMGRKIAALTDAINLQAQVDNSITPPNSPPAQSRGLDNQTLGPNDSSSVLDRYSKRFLPNGTVLSTQRAGNFSDAQEGRSRLTVEGALVNGFQPTEEIVKAESHKIGKLKPINGLPRPFTNNRLNFLCNIHTAMQYKLKKNEGSYINAMFSAMRSSPNLPVEDLLHQVLNATIDKHKGVYASNGFELPYIEVGMVFTEESVVKMFDLLQLEYKRLWFQEMKNLIVPKFHEDYKGISVSVLDSKSAKPVTIHDSKSKHSNRSKKSSRSVLGF